MVAGTRLLIVVSFILPTLALLIYLIAISLPQRAILPPPPAPPHGGEWRQSPLLTLNVVVNTTSTSPHVLLTLSGAIAESLDCISSVESPNTYRHGQLYQLKVWSVLEFEEFQLASSSSSPPSNVYKLNINLNSPKTATTEKITSLSDSLKLSTKKRKKLVQNTRVYMSMSPADDRLCTVDFLPSSSSTLESNAESNSQHELNLLKAVAYNFANGVLSPPPYASADDPSAVYGCDDNSDFQVTFALVDEDPGFSAPSPSISPSISSNSTYTTVDITSISNFFSPKNNDFPTTRIPTSLNTSRSSNLNFVLFVPSVQNTPLYVVDSRRQKSIKKKRKDTNREFNENDDENLKKSFSLENRGGGVILNLEYYQGEAASSASNNNYNRKISWDFHEIRNLLIDPFIHMIQPACGNVKVDSIISLYGTLHTKADSYSRRQFDPASCNNNTTNNNNNNNTILPSVFCSSSIRNLHSIPPPATLPRQLHLTAADLYTPISHLISIMRSTLLKLPSPHQQSHSSANYGGTIIFDGIDFSDSVMLEIRPSSTGVAVHEVDHMIREMFSNKWARAVENLEAVVKIATLSVSERSERALMKTRILLTMNPAKWLQTLWLHPLLN